MSERKEWKATDYDLLIEQFKALASETRDYLPLLSNLSALLYQELFDINWVGFYLRKGEDLILGPFQGKPACMRIASGRGVCGTAFSENRIQRVGNVHEFPGHIACDTASNSEIVVPVHDRTTRGVVGVLDVDSPSYNRFDTTDEELKELRKLGINELNIGVESGWDEALVRMQKGYSREQAVFGLKRLRAAGIDYGANIIFGVAGSGNWKENAEATAELINETKPYLIFTGTIHAEQGCPLYDDLREGGFSENTFDEYLKEEELFLSLLDLEDCLYFGLHPSNVVPMQGYLPREKERMLGEIKQRRRELARYLTERPVRGGERSILIKRGMEKVY